MSGHEAMGQAFRAKFRNAFIAAVEAKLATMTEAERIAFMQWFVSADAQT